MDKLNITLLGIMSVTGIAGMQACSSEAPAVKQPNIVLIMADDMGKECIGAYGCTEYKTPNIDRLASQAIRFEHCFSQPLCTPSRVKIMTGLQNFRNYEDFGYLNPSQVTFANMLKEAGYATCVAGKWQLNGLNRNNPGNQDTSRPYHFGFDEYCLWQLHHTRAQGERYADPLITCNGEDLPRNKDAYGPDIFSDYVCDFISRKAGQPFFVYYPMVLIHDPFVPTPDSPAWQDPERRYEQDTAYVADMTAYLDKIILKIEKALRDNGVWENTLFIFTSDNGTKPGVITRTIHGDIEGGKSKTINTGFHVPMIVTWPDKIRQGVVSDRLVDFSDVLPTLAEAAGVPADSYTTDGTSFMDVLLGKQRNTKPEVFMHYAPRWGNNSGKSQHNRLVTDGKYKLYRNGEFYNTKLDPDELAPLSTLSAEEESIFRRFDGILREKEEHFPFAWNDKEFRPGGNP